MSPARQATPAARRMRRDERQKKFHEALLRIYHPPSAPKSMEQQEGTLDLGLGHNTEDVVVVVHEEEEEEKEVSVSEKSDDVAPPAKLSRAQRKRIRKRKLKEEEEEAACVRRKLIGPLLPSGYHHQEDPKRD